MFSFHFSKLVFQDRINKAEFMKRAGMTTDKIINLTGLASAIGDLAFKGDRIVGTLELTQGKVHATTATLCDDATL